MNFCRECVYKELSISAEPCTSCLKENGSPFFIKDNIKVYENDINEVFKRFGQMKYRQGYNKAIIDVIHLLEK